MYVASPNRENGLFGDLPKSSPGCHAFSTRAQLSDRGSLSDWGGVCWLCNERRWGFRVGHWTRSGCRGDLFA